MSKRSGLDDKIVAKWNQVREEGLKSLGEQNLSKEIYDARRSQLEEDVYKAINLERHNELIKRERIFFTSVTFVSSLLVISLIQAGMNLKYTKYRAPIINLPYQEETTPEKETDEIIYFEEM